MNHGPPTDHLFVNAPQSAEDGEGIRAVVALVDDHDVRAGSREQPPATFLPSSVSCSLTSRKDT